MTLSTHDGYFNCKQNKHADLRKEVSRSIRVKRTYLQISNNPQFDTVYIKLCIFFFQYNFKNIYVFMHSEPILEARHRIPSEKSIWETNWAELSSSWQRQGCIRKAMFRVDYRQSWQASLKNIPAENRKRGGAHCSGGKLKNKINKRWVIIRNSKG